MPIFNKKNDQSNQMWSKSIIMYLKIFLPCLFAVVIFNVQQAYAAESVEIKLSTIGKEVLIEVIKGSVKIGSDENIKIIKGNMEIGSDSKTIWGKGSVLNVKNADVIICKPGTMILVRKGGVKLRGKDYPENTKLISGKRGEVQILK